MTLRLVLVSVVACLGLSLPSAERLERWGRSSQAWMNGRLAEWEDGEPLDEGRFVVIADVPDAPPVAAPAVGTPAAAPSVAVKTVEDDAEAKAVMAEWLAAIEREAAPPADNVPAPAPSEETQVAAAPPEETVIDAPVLVTEAERDWWNAWLEDVSRPLPIGSALPEPVVEAPQVVAEAPATPKVDSADNVFSAIVEEMASSFTKDAEALAARTKSEPAPTPEVHAAVPPARPAFEPLEVDTDDSKDVAYALNREAEGLTPPAPVATKAPAPQENRLSHAMRLTREAVNAWANLLHGPALVTLER